MEKDGFKEIKMNFGASNYRVLNPKDADNIYVINSSK